MSNYYRFRRSSICAQTATPAANGPLKVALAVNAMHPGGVATFILRAGEELQKLGFEVEVVTVEVPGDLYQLPSARGLSSRHLVPRLKWMPFYRQLHILRCAAFFRGRYDAIILNHAAYLQAGLGLLKGKQVAIPVIHNDSEGVYRIGLANPRQWDMSVAVSKKIYDECRMRLPDKPCELVNYGIDIPSLGESTSRRPHSLPLKLLYLGRLDREQKNVILLFEILRECLRRSLNVRLTIVGEGPERQRLQTLFEQASLMPLVEFRPFCDPLEVRNYYLQHHVLLLPSIYEGFGMVLTEAQAHGCVPIVNRIPGVTDEAVRHEDTGFLVDNNQVEQFGQYIAQLYRDPADWQRLSENGMARTRALFSRERMGTSYAALVKELVAMKITAERASRHCPRIDFSIYGKRGYLPRWALQVWESYETFRDDRRKANA